MFCSPVVSVSSSWANQDKGKTITKADKQSQIIKAKSSKQNHQSRIITGMRSWNLDHGGQMIIDK